MLLVLPHFANNFGVASRQMFRYFQRVHQFHQMALQGLDKSFQQMVVICFVFAGCKTAVDRHLLLLLLSMSIE